MPRPAAATDSAPLRRPRTRGGSGRDASHAHLPTVAANRFANRAGVAHAHDPNPIPADPLATITRVAVVCAAQGVVAQTTPPPPDGVGVYVSGSVNGTNNYVGNGTVSYAAGPGVTIHSLYGAVLPAGASGLSTVGYGPVGPASARLDEAMRRDPARGDRRPRELPGRDAGLGKDGEAA